MNAVEIWIYGISLACMDPTGLAAIYREDLGLPLSEDPETGSWECNLGDAVIRLVPCEAGGCASPGMELTLVVEDPVGVHLRTSSRGTWKVTQLRSDGEGRSFRLVDPEGHRLRVLAPSDPVLKELRARRHRQGPVPDLGLPPTGRRRGPGDA